MAPKNGNGRTRGFLFFLFVRLLRGVSFLDGVLYATCGTKRVRTHVRVAVFGVAGRAHETATLGGSLAATGPHVQRSLAGERRAQPARAVCRVGRLLRNSSWFHRVISTHFLSLSLSLGSGRHILRDEPSSYPRLESPMRRNDADRSSSRVFTLIRTGSTQSYWVFTEFSLAPVA